MAALYTTTHLSGEPNRPLALEPRVFGNNKVLSGKLCLRAVRSEIRATAFICATCQYAHA